MAKLEIRLHLQNEYLTFYGEDLLECETSPISFTELNKPVYNIFASEGTIVFKDNNLQLYKKAEQGVFNNYSYLLEILVNGNKIAEHTTNRLPKYDYNAKTLTIDLSNSISTLDNLQYKGYSYPEQSLSLTSLFFHLMVSAFNIEYADFMEMMNIEYANNATFFQLFDSVIIDYPFIKEKPYRTAFANILSIVHCWLGINNQGKFRLIYVDKTLSMVNDEDVYRIYPYQTVKAFEPSIMVQNKYDNCEVIGAKPKFDFQSTVLGSATKELSANDSITESENFNNNFRGTIPISKEKDSDATAILQDLTNAVSFYYKNTGFTRHEPIYIAGKTIIQYKNLYANIEDFSIEKTFDDANLSEVMTFSEESPLSFTLYAKKTIKKYDGTCKIEQLTSVSTIGYPYSVFIYKVKDGTVVANGATEVSETTTIADYQFTNDSQLKFTKDGWLSSDTYEDYSKPRKLTASLDLQDVEDKTSYEIYRQGENTFLISDLSIFCGKEYSYVDFEREFDVDEVYPIGNQPCTVYIVRIEPIKLEISVLGTLKTLVFNEFALTDNEKSYSNLAQIDTYGELLQSPESAYEQINHITDYYKNGIHTATINVLGDIPYTSRTGEKKANPFEIGDIVEVVKLNNAPMMYYPEGDVIEPIGMLWQVLYNNRVIQGGGVTQELKLREIAKDYENTTKLYWQNLGFRGYNEDVGAYGLANYSISPSGISSGIVGLYYSQLIYSGKTLNFPAINVSASGGVGYTRTLEFELVPTLATLTKVTIGGDEITSTTSTQYASYTLTDYPNVTVTERAILYNNTIRITQTISGTVNTGETEILIPASSVYVSIEGSQINAILSGYELKISGFFEATANSAGTALTDEEKENRTYTFADLIIPVEKSYQQDFIVYDDYGYALAQFRLITDNIQESGDNLVSLAGVGLNGERTSVFVDGAYAYGRLVITKIDIYAPKK